MAEKRLIENQPKFGNLSQYNFDDNEIDFSYENSNGLPVNNDKFQNKDLYTLAEGSEAIMLSLREIYNLRLRVLLNLIKFI